MLEATLKEVSSKYLDEKQQFDGFEYYTLIEIAMFRWRLQTNL